MKLRTNLRIITSLAFTIPFTLLFLIACDWEIEDQERQISEANLTVEARAEATEHALATAQMEATLSPIEYPSEEATASQPPPDQSKAIQCDTEAECNNAGVHEFEVAVEESEFCGAGDATSVRYTIEFKDEGVNMQVYDNAPAFYTKLENDQYHLTLSNGDRNQLAFDSHGFTIVQTKADGNPCLTYYYTRVD